LVIEIEMAAGQVERLRHRPLRREGKEDQCEGDGRDRGVDAEGADAAPHHPGTRSGDDIARR
jgi:hypothetical protein